MMGKKTKVARVDSIGDNKVKKYLMYAVGEIVLVVVGILIALQLGNVYSAYKTDETINNYFQKIESEIDEQISENDNYRLNYERLVGDCKRLLHVINSKNADSLHLNKHLLGSLGTAWISNFNFPITDEFLKLGYLSKVKNDSIKDAFRSFTLLIRKSNTVNKYTEQQYNNTIEPFFNLNINYSEVAILEYQEGLIKGGPITSYITLTESFELWNIAMFKLENATAQLQISNRADVVLKDFKKQLQRSNSH